MPLLRQLLGGNHGTKRRPIRFRPSLELLDDRIVPTVSAITSNFNGTAIPAGASIWFSSVGKVSGLGSDPVTIHITNATITSGAFTVAVPDSDITITPAAATASTTFDAATNTWDVTIPRSGFSGNLFLSGATLSAPTGLPGGIKPVVWQADFTADSPSISVSWTWAAAVYTSFSTDYNAVGVKPVDGSGVNPYRNSDHAGTPENFKSFVLGGARGGGGSNFTGSYSATKFVAPGQSSPQLGSISGNVYLDLNDNGVRDQGEAGIAGVVIILTGTDDQGNAVTATTYTDDSGEYHFIGLEAGTYQVFEVQPQDYIDGLDAVGTVNGVQRGQLTDNDTIGSIVLAAGQNGVHYDFGELLAGS
ncbi:MAG TPA: SdrD B-like domain-containing protein [Gemmataceae bacterium]|jgi:hypothetical protein